MKRDINKILSVICLILIPLIIYQWYMKLVWLRLNQSTLPLSYIHWLTLGYFLAYGLIYERNEIGCIFCWTIFIILSIINVFYNRINIFDFAYAIDLWANIILTISAIVFHHQKLKAKSLQ